MTDVLVGVLRVAHALAAATWMGGTFVWAIAPPDAGSREAQWRGGFREAIRVGIGVFIVTGVILAAHRLAGPALPPTYLGLLAIKIGLGIRMFALARRLGTAPGAGRLAHPPEREILILGVMVYALAVALRAIYEGALRP